MGRSPKALVEPMLLVWARESAGLSLDEVAAKLRQDQEKIEGWENGEGNPSIAQLRRLSLIYKRPLALFFLSEPPRDFAPVRDFRRLADHSQPEEITPKLRSEIRRVLDIRDAALSLLEDSDEDETPHFSVTGARTQNPDELAENLRKSLGISFEQQTSWTNSFTALGYWRLAIENQGVLVLQASGVSLNEMRGFSVADDVLPLICLNASDTANGRVFSLIHEYVHIALREGGLCEWEHPEGQTAENAAVESFCNRVAGALLVPAGNLLEEPIVRASGRMKTWSDGDIGSLARKFSVSREVIVRRLVIEGLADESFYKKKRKELLEEYSTPRARATFPVPYARRVVNATGKVFIGLVLGSYHDRRLSLAETSSLIGVRVKHLPAIEREVFGWSHSRTAAG